MEEHLDIFMVEDDPELAELLTVYLKNYHIYVEVCSDPLKALPRLDEKTYDLVILDLTLPGMDGLTLCEMICNKHSIPVIISSARNNISDKVLALEKGADDYLPKPYDPRELVARIHAVLRRKIPDAKDEQHDDFMIDEKRMVIAHKSEVLDLTVAEYGLLVILLKQRGMVLSRDDILDKVTGMNWESGERSIDVIISRLRHKLGDSSRSPEYIESIRGVGYRMKL